MLVKSLIKKMLFFTFLIVLISQPSFAENTEYVRRDGVFFREGLERFYPIGANSYYLMMYAADEGTRHYVDEVLEDAAAMNLNLIRMWAFNDRPGDWGCLQSEPGVFDEDVFRGLDYVLDKADQLDIRVILTLVNNWPDYGGMDQYVRWDFGYGTGPKIASRHNDFYTDSDCRMWYKNFASELMNRTNTLNGRIYKEDPTVFAWELANEPRAEGDITGDLIQGWIEEMSFYIKRVIGIEQMLSVGSEGIGDVEDVGTDFIRNHEQEYIDFATVHLWPEQRGMSIDDGIAWLEGRTEQARYYLNRPLIIEEFGWSRDGGTTDRDLLYDEVFDTVYEKKAAGALFWSLFHDDYYIYDDGYGVYYPNDETTVEVITRQARRSPFNVLEVPGIYATIQSAVYAAESGDIILISPGTYHEHVSVCYSKEGITFQGLDRETCVISGDEEDRALLFIPKSGYWSEMRTAPHRVSGLTITKGKKTGYHEQGAGICVGGDNRIEISDCIISDNRQTYGGIGGGGGGIYCGSFYEEGAYTVIKNNIIRDNYVADSGAGIYAYYCDGLRIYDNLIEDNTAHISGGGIYCLSSGETRPVEIRGNVIIKNTAREYGGAGIACYANALIANNIIAINQKIDGWSWGNWVRMGGGILCGGADTAQTIVNNVFYNNSATHGYKNGRGGAIGILENGRPIIKNNIFSANWAEENASDDIFAADGADPAITYCLFDSIDVDGTDLGEGCFERFDLGFADLETFYLEPDSPAINTGDPAILDIDFTRSDMGVHGGPLASTIENVYDIPPYIPPILITIGDKTVEEGHLLEFYIYADGGDSDDLVFSASNLPPGAIFDASEKCFSWRPTYEQAGIYPGVCFEVTDGRSRHKEFITITVNECTDTLVASVNGRVRKSYYGAPIEGATVTITDGESVFQATTNKYGDFSIDDIPIKNRVSCDYSAVVTATGYFDLDKGIFTLYPEDKHYLNCRMRAIPSAVIYGRVKDEYSKEYLEGVQVTVTDGETMLQTVTDLNGYYLLEHIPVINGEKHKYNMVISKDGYFEKIKNYKFKVDKTYKKNYKIQKKTATFSGTVMSKPKPYIPVANAELILRSKDGLHVYTTTTDESGNFQMEDIFAKMKYTLTIKIDGREVFSKKYKLKKGRYYTKKYEIRIF